MRIRRDEAYESEQFNFLLDSESSDPTHHVGYEHSEDTNGVEHYANTIKKTLNKSDRMDMAM